MQNLGGGCTDLKPFRALRAIFQLNGHGLRGQFPSKTYKTQISELATLSSSLTEQFILVLFGCVQLLRSLLSLLLPLLSLLLLSSRHVRQAQMPRGSLRVALGLLVAQPRRRHVLGLSSHRRRPAANRCR